MITEFLVSILVVCLVAAVTYFLFKNSDSSNSSIVSTIRDGKVSSDYSTTIPVSKDQSEGLVFSYAGWVRIDDFTYRYGEQKIIFVKGADNLKSVCPALVLDANTNSFLVILDTYGTREIVPISNIPSKKWIHFAIVVEQTAVNIYINGTLHTHHTLNQLPRQNTGPVHLSPKGGFAGKLGQLEYFPNVLKSSDVSALSLVAPEVDKSDNGIGTLPPYFDRTWWIKKNGQH